MNTFDATVSMLESMPEEARILVFNYTKDLFTSRKPANPFIPITTERVLDDLNEARQQTTQGLSLNAQNALNDMRIRHGLV